MSWTHLSFHFFQKEGIDTDDPSFTYFDFQGYGERYIQKNGVAMAPMVLYSELGRRLCGYSPG